MSNSLDPDQAQHFCKGYQQTTKRVKGETQRSKHVTSAVALLVFISNLIGCWFAGELTCGLTDSSHQLSNHGTHHLDQACGLILSAE